MNPLESIVSDFLLQHYDPVKPVLLALSGGPDSLAMLHLLQKFQEKHPLQFGIAHIDHGWRKESCEEAQQLFALAKMLKLPFHLKQLHPSQLSGNLEAACREERLQFYKELCQQHGYQAVILAHHADDQAETVLKRVLEGSSLPNLSGLKSVTCVDGVQIWRPLLTTRKSSIERLLKAEGIEPFIDSTNLDPRFLRGRFRVKIIPQLSQEFGKEVGPSLCSLAQEAQELNRFMQAHMAPYLLQICKGPFGTLLDLSENCPKTAYEIKFLVREFCSTVGCFLSRELVEQACQLIQSEKANRQFAMGNSCFFVDRKRLFFLKDTPKKPLEQHRLQEGEFKYGAWQVSVTPCKHVDVPLQIGWKNVWRGEVSVVLPEGIYHFEAAKTTAPYPGRTASISKWWNNEKVPMFLKNHIPVIWEGDCIRHEWLTPRSRQDSKPLSNGLLIKMRYL